MAPLISAMRTPGFTTLAKRAEVGQVLFNPDYINYNYGVYDEINTSYNDGYTGLGVVGATGGGMNSVGTQPNGGVAPIFVMVNPRDGRVNVVGDHQDVDGEGMVTYGSASYDRFTTGLAGNTLSPYTNIFENHSPSTLNSVDFNSGGANVRNAYFKHDLNDQYFGKDVYFVNRGDYRVYHSRVNTGYEFGLPGATLTPVGSYSLGSTAVGYVYGLWFKPDGTKMYVCGCTDWHPSIVWTVRGIAQYDLSTPWDITTATQTYRTSNAGGTGDTTWTTYKGIMLNEIGTVLYVIKYSGRYREQMTLYINAYELSTPWDISTRTSIRTYYTSTTWDSSYGSTNEWFFTGGNYDYQKGKYFYISLQADITTNDRQYAYIVNHGVNTPASEFVYAGKSLLTASATRAGDPERVSDIAPDYDGTKVPPTGLVRGMIPTLKPGNNLEKFWLHSHSSNTNTTYEYSLSTPGTISSASYASVSFDRSSLSTLYRPYTNVISPMRFSSDGTKFLQYYYPYGISDRYIGYATLSSAWDISSATFSNYYSLINDVTSVLSLVTGSFTISPDGDKFWMIEYSTSPTTLTMHEWTMSTAWNLSTASHNTTYDLRSSTPYNTTDYPELYTVSFLWHPDGTKFWMQSYYYNSSQGRYYAVLLEFSCATAWDPSTRAYVKTYTPIDFHAKRADSPIDLRNSGNYMLGWNDGGTKLYVWNDSRNNIQEWTLEAP